MGSPEPRLAADGGIASSCLLCGGHGRADATCPTCLVPMPRATCVRCGAIHGPLSTTCRACASPLGGDPTPFGAACPRCQAHLDSAPLEGDVAVRVCGSCHGVFVGPRAWCVLRRRMDLADALAARLGAPRPSAALIPLLRCPVCRTEMDRGRFAATSPTVIDACPHQHGLWLDAGELGDVLRYAEHRSAVGVTAARVEAEIAERNATGWDPGQARLQSELLRLQVAEATHTWDAKKSSILALVILILMRAGWAIAVHHRMHSAPPPQIDTSSLGR